MQDFLKKFTLPIVVFITGACVLIIEITAIRILSPYFGNTIFAVSSVISVVLLALSLGYYFGGKIADKYPQETIFFKIIAASGFLVIFLHLAGIFFLSGWGYKLSIIEGPIISSLFLFFAQSFLLGMLSPFAIKLQALRMQELGVGSVSGQIFFWSTLGSIFGSLSAGFLLIPNFGVDKIILSVGFLLIILGLFGNLKINGFVKIFLLFFLISTCFFLTSAASLQYANAVFAKDGVYQRIVIFDGDFEGKPARFLIQDRNSSAAELIGSDELAYDYTKYYKLYEIFNKDIKNALVIGGGAYSIPKAILKDLPNATVDVSEIEPEIFEIVKKHFRVQDNPRLKNFVKDGRRVLYDSPKKYDLIFGDAYSSFFSIPQHLATKEFFELAKEKMNDNGVFIANVIGSIEEKPKSFALSEIKTFKSVFENSYFFATKLTDLQKVQNLIFVGYKSDKIMNFNSPEITGSENKIISGLSEKLIDLSKYDFSRQYILTDNFAPVDYLISKEFKNLN
ncbi:MAG: fused MFS/spermidine synthase [Patescibacteria group bacterium]